jgi:peptide/nickel transport system permease protein
MRLVDFQLSFPLLLLAIILAAVLQPSASTVIVVLVISGWPAYARLVRAQAVSLKSRDFVVASRVLGSSATRTLGKHVLPNTQNVIVVMATVQMAQFIIAESTLSFLGLGILPPAPSWGGMINEGRDYVWSAWWIQTLPGVLIVLCVSAIGLLGDWMRDVTDPRTAS